MENKTYIEFFKALANEERLEMVRLLKKEKELNASEVESHFYLEQSTTSHHLNKLQKAGILKNRRGGRNIFYSVDEDNIKTIFEAFSEELIQNMEATE